MVTISIVCSLVVALLTTAVQAASLTVDPSTIERGKYANVTVRYTDHAAAPTLDVSRWFDDFHVEPRHVSVETAADGTTEQVARFRVYPRKTGRLTLQSISIGALQTEPATIRITPSVRDGIEGTPTGFDLPDRLWVGESIETCVDMPLYDRNNTLKVSDLNIPGVAVRVSRSDRIEIANGMLERHCWSLTALEEGKLPLTPPSITQRGKGRWTFYLPLQTINVWPNPAYLPPTIAIGSPTIRVELVRQAQQAFWSIELTPASVTSTELHGVRKAIAERLNRPIDGLAFDHVMRSEAPFSVQRITVELPRWLWGWGTPIEIPIRYFDTAEGKLSVSSFALPRTWRVPRWASVAGASILVGLIAYGAFYFRGFLCAVIRRQWLKRKIQRSRSADELYQLLLRNGDLGHCIRPRAFQSLSAWAQSHPRSPFKTLADELNRMRFSGRALRDLSAYKNKLISEL